MFGNMFSKLIECIIIKVDIHTYMSFLQRYYYFHV